MSGENSAKSAKSYRILVNYLKGVIHNDDYKYYSKDNNRLDAVALVVIS